jgi:hypothetical protein
MIAASAPIARIDIAFIICFLVHKEAGPHRVKRYPKQIATKTLASCQESSLRISRSVESRWIITAAEQLKDGPIWRDAICRVQLFGTDGGDPRFEKIVASLAPQKR